MTEPCATCKWVWDEAGLGVASRYEGPAMGPPTVILRTISCKQRHGGAAIQMWPDQGGCPRWERREDLADRVAKAVRSYLRDMPCRVDEAHELRALAEVVRPLLEEGKL